VVVVNLDVSDVYPEITHISERDLKRYYLLSYFHVTHTLKK